MITSIEIENFRCFEYTKIEGFSRVNLIGGKNNSGKTALLEAILLNQSPRFETIEILNRIRDESTELQRKKPEDFWNYFFFKENIKDNMILRTITKEFEIIEVLISVQKETRKLSEDLQNEWHSKALRHCTDKGSAFKNDPNNCAILKIIKTILFDSAVIELHHLYVNSSLYGILYKRNDKNVPYPQYISARLEVYRDHFNRDILESSLAQEYNQLMNHDQKKILNILKIIDSSLEKIELIDHKTPDSPMLYLKRENEDPLPLAYFGDAMSRVLKIALNLINNQSHYLMIDEIENGIHYTNHRDFWKALFELAKQLNVQIFATTHSLEMIQAFRDIGLENYQGEGVYFEMARSPRTDKIVGIEHDLELLDYELKRNEGVRGE